MPRLETTARTPRNFLNAMKDNHVQSTIELGTTGASAGGFGATNVEKEGSRYLR